MHCHHEKVVVVDDEVAFVGGIDLTALAGDRFDSSAHPPRGRPGLARRGDALPWPGRRRRRAATSRPLAGDRRRAPSDAAERRRAGDVELQLVRTVPERTYDFAPTGDFRIFEAYLRALRSAEPLIYLENQFLWSAEILEILADKLRSPPTRRLPAGAPTPREARTTAPTPRAGSSAGSLDADGGQGRVLPPRSTHARHPQRFRSTSTRRSAIVDDRWLTVGSANLNEHSLFNDTEVNVVTTDPETARRTRSGAVVGAP